MIREYALEMRKKLGALGCPVQVIDDHEGTGTVTFARSRILLADDDDSPDTFGPPRGAQKNPRTYFSCTVSAKLSVYAQSTAKGALPWEHRRLARKLVDASLSALHEIAVIRRNELSGISGGFAKIDDLDASERPHGALYVVRFGVVRSVPSAVTWETAAAPEFVLTEDGFASRTLAVDNPNTPEASASTGCGA